MKKRKLLGQNGITLVEIIIVIAIIGILASTSVMMIGHLHYANTQKVVRTLDSSLDALQVRTMTKPAVLICIFTSWTMDIIRVSCPIIWAVLTIQS